MPVAALSPEGRLETGLRDLNCSGRSFVEIGKALGARIAHGPFSEALSGKKPLDRETGTRLLDILQRMCELESEIDAPIDWSRSQRVSNALTVRLVAKIAAELHVEDAGLEASVTRAMQQMR